MASETPGSTVSLVGQGSFLTKPSPHMVGCTGKKNGSFATPPDGLCPLCKTKGQSQVLKTYRINFTQSIFLCSDPQCIYPLGHTPLNNIITNTADLKNHIPNNPKKRNISELSPPLQPNGKRTKCDLPVLSHYSPINAATSVQAESSTSEHVVPPGERDAPSGISLCDWTENREVPKQNVPETSCAISSSTSVLNGKCSPLASSPGSHYIPGTSHLFSADEALQFEDGKIIDKLHCTDAVNQISNRLSEMDVDEIKESKERSMSEPCSFPELTKSPNPVSENRPTLNGSPGILENNLSLNSVPVSHPQAVSSPPRGEESAVFEDSSSVESAEPCDFIMNMSQNPCESLETHITSCADNVLNDTIVVVERSSAEGDQQRDLSMSPNLIVDPSSAALESTVPLVSEQNNKSEEILNKTLKSVSPRHAEASVEQNTNDPEKALELQFSKALHLKHDSCGTIGTSYSQHDIEPTCLSDNDTVSVNGPPCTMDSSMKDCSIEMLTDSPLKVCFLSTFLEPADDEKVPPSSPIKDILSERTEVDSSLNVPGFLFMSGAGVNDSNASPEKALSPEDHISVQDDIVDGCPETATPSLSVQDILSECQSKKSMDVPLSPCPSLSAPTDKNSTNVTRAELLPNNPLPEPPGPIRISDGVTPSDSITVSEPEHKNSPQIEVYNTVAPVSEKDDRSTSQDVTSSLDNPLIRTLEVTEESMETCEVSTEKIEEHATSDVNGSICNIKSAFNGGDHAGIPPVVSDGQKESTGSTPTTCSPADVEEETHPLHDKAAVEDIAVASLSDSEEINRTVKKTSFENTILPDLLLDIQPEHRMEEQKSAVPSPTCDADLMKIIPRDSKQTEDLLQSRMDKDCVQEAEINKMEITDPDISENKLQNSIGLSDTLSSQGTFTESFESGPMDTSAANLEQPPSDQILETRTFENSQRLPQWINRKSLCWLDCILSTLVFSRALAMFVAKEGDKKESVIFNLFARYNEAVELCKDVGKKYKPGHQRRTDACLNEVRMQIFDKLQPLLKCELGKHESPVFAFPLLLKLDPDFEKFFEHSFTWHFTCKFCGCTYRDRCQKIMTTFTKIVPGWLPLNAVHNAPCNSCKATDQMRRMHLETLQSMFMLHFVEGLPSNDLAKYAFQFGEHWYDIKTVIRYRDEHFSTWLANDDGTWLESDDLKGPFCRRHNKFRMRAEDIHIVIWERSKKKEESAQLSSTMCASDMESDNQMPVPSVELSPQEPSKEFLFVAPEAKVGKVSLKDNLPQVVIASESIVPDAEHPVVVTPVVETCPPALPFVFPVPTSNTDKTCNPLAGMDGYAEDDVITLTLVEVPVDSMGQPIDPEPPNQCVTQVETITNNVIQPTFVEEQHTSVKQPEQTVPTQRTHLRSKPLVSSTASPCTTKPSLAQPGHQKKQISSTPAAAVATSTPRFKSFSTKKSVADSMMSTLAKNDNFFVNSTFSSSNKKPIANKTWQPVNLLKESDLNGIPKKAENFGGFQARTANRTNNSGSSLLLSKLLNNSATSVEPKEKPTPPVKSFLAPAGQMKAGKSGLSYGKMLAKDGSVCSEDKVKKLRMKLLKKLKAKKSELAMLEKMGKFQHNGSHAGEGDGALPGTVNRQDHLRGFLQELQDHIDNADTESVGTASSCTSICSSPGDAEFFAELFSAPPVDNTHSDGSFLEMLADGHTISEQASGFNNPGNNTVLQPTAAADSFHSTFNQSSSAEESLNLLSSSTMQLISEDNGYLDSFSFF